MAIERDAGHRYVGGSMAAFTGRSPFGTGSRIVPGMFRSAGGRRDVCSGTTTTLTRVQWT